jgi:hypothetical protein
VGAAAAPSPAALALAPPLLLLPSLLLSLSPLRLRLLLPLLPALACTHARLVGMIRFAISWFTDAFI